MISEAHGIPLAVSLTGSNRNDIARRGTDHGSGPGTHRWVPGQSIALLH